MTTDQILQTLHEWREFYSLEGAASATLMGLLFIAVALNADLILSGHPKTKIRAEQAFQNYVSVLVMSQMLLFPKLPPQALSVSIVVQCTVMIAIASIRLVKTARSKEQEFDRNRPWGRMIPSIIAYGLIVYGGLNLTDPPAFFDIGFGSIILLMTATATSWELLVRVAEIRHAMGGVGRKI